MPPILSHHAVWRFAFWALLAITVWMSLVPANQVPNAFHFWDKAQHALGFAALAGLGLLAYPGRSRTVIAALLFLGVGIECAQALTGWREGDWQDWIADAVGIGFGAGAYICLKKCK